MGSPRIGACSAWATADDLCEPCLTGGPTPTDDQLQMASDILFELSGHRFPGVCEDVVRPCGRSLSNDGPMSYSDVGSVSYAGWGRFALGDSCGCGNGRSCGCNRPSEITLGGWPVVGVSQVKVDGAIVAPSLYRVDDYRYLVRLPAADGSNPGWPCCQDVSLASTEEDTFEVSYTYGVAPPAAGVMAAAAFACEIALACTGGDGCRLPRRVTQVVRQGVTMATILDPFDFLDNGRTGVYEADLFLSTYGPGRKKRLGTQVVNPDIHRAVRRAGT